MTQKTIARIKPFVSQRMLAIPPSGLVKFFDLLANTEDVLSLGIGEPDLPTPWPIRDAAMRALHAGVSGYTCNAGLPSLRRAIADELARRYGVAYNPDSEVLVTAGVSEALHLALLAVVNPRETVLLPEPCFAAYDPCVRLAGARPLPIATSMADGFQLGERHLQEAVWRNTKALLLNYPNNPTGAVLEPWRMEEIARFAEQQDLVVISDEIYDRFVYEAPHRCFAALPGMRARTILLGGFSKSYAMTGWRIGYACAPAEILEAMHRIHQYILMSAPTLAQLGALEGLCCPRDCADEIIAEFAARRAVVLRGLSAIGLPCATPGGAIYAFPSIRETGLDCETFSLRLLSEERVAVVPGTAFGRAGAGHVRIAYTAPIPRLEEALERMDRFVRRI
jgi:aminotransferase